MKYKNWTIFIGVGLLVVAYYYYTLPFAVEVGGLKFEVNFPAKPRKLQFPLQLSPAVSAPMEYYQVKTQEDSEYSLMVISLPADYYQRLSQSTLLNNYFNYLHLQAGVGAKGAARPSFLGPYNGQSATFVAEDRILYARYYVTPAALVAVVASAKGQVLPRDERQFVDQLNISVTE